MPRLRLQTPIPLIHNTNDEAVYPAGLGYPNAKRLSYHNDFSNFVVNPIELTTLDEQGIAERYDISSP
jgi:hypothetical protein